MGGSESNFAIALRRLGTSLTWVGRVGNDSLGELVLRELAAEGIGFPLRDESAPTGLMIKERRTMDQLKVWSTGPEARGSRRAREDTPADRIANARLLHLTGITPAPRCGPPTKPVTFSGTSSPRQTSCSPGTTKPPSRLGKSDDSLELAGRIAALGRARRSSSAVPQAVPR
ncbi:PfkB family carbohydrate kinase [Pseudarthrobacter sp. MDT3-9]|nr:PfkB family carbohydrate kinase [Pseudarthrobacter sp. MDT3-9]MCO4250493.1 PfkB family carbohydrate kinase [Pseudarthrobacter sp. MDT3-9]